MARIALAVAGGIIGAIIGGPAGAELGFSLGNILGAALFPAKLPTQYGPRLNDKQITSSAAGEPIPWGYGGFRISGNIIWADQIKEIKTSQTQSAKGGPSQSSVTYSYTCSFAIGFCEGPASILRIWADSKLIYDATGKTATTLDTGIMDSGGVSRTVKFTPTIYTGTATQNPDPTIESFLGAGNTSAYRDICYAVFTDFPLADFGNRIPTIRAEISTGNTLAYIKDAYPANSLGRQSDGTVFPYQTFLVDPINRVGYLLDSLQIEVTAVDLNVDSTQPLNLWQASTVYNPGDQILDSNGNVQYVKTSSSDHKSGVSQPTWATVDGLTTNDNHVVWVKIGAGPNAVTVLRTGRFDPTFGTYAFPTDGSSSVNSGGPLAMTIDTTGYIWGQAQDSNTGKFHPIKYDPITFKAVAVFDPPGWGGQPVQGINSAKIAGVDKVYIVTATNFSPSSLLWIANAKTMVGTGGIGWQPSDLLALTITGYPTIDPTTGIVYIVAGRADALGWGIVKIDPRASFFFFGAGVPSWPSTIFRYSNTSATGPGSTIFYDTIDNTLIVINGWGPGGGTGTFKVIWKINPADGTIITNTPLTGQAFAAANQLVYPAAYHGLVPSNGILKLQSNDAKSWLYYQTSDLSIVNTVGISNWEPNIGSSSESFTGFAFDDASDSMLLMATTYNPVPLRFFFDRQVVQSETVDQIVLDLLQRSGVPSANIDVSAITNLTCLGYCVARTSDAKATLQPLCTAFFFDLVESDFKIKAIPRGQTPSQNIPEDDLGIVDDQYKLVETIAQEQDLPKTVSVEYQDPKLNYQQGKQHRYRSSRVKKTKNHDILSLPLTMQGDTAAQVADKYLSMVWAERNLFDSKLWRAKYLVVDPTDVVQFTYEGKVFQSRIVKDTLGQNKILQINGVSEDARQYLSTLNGADTQGFIPGTLTIAGATLFFLLDTPLLQDIDGNGANTGFYYLMSTPQSGTWPGANLYTSGDGANFGSAVDADFDEATYGIVTTATPQPQFRGNGVPHPFSWDFDTTITVRLAQGSLSSTTELAVLNGANAFVLGGEVMAFQFATLNSDGTYTLSKLIRGARGTEYFCRDHQAGETFLLLNTATKRLPLSASIIGLLRYYKAVTLGTSQSSGSVIQNTLIGNDLKPYAPAQFGGTVDGSHNINMAWVRRTRLGGSWLDGTGTVPLSEETESYDLDVMWLNLQGRFDPHYTSSPDAGIAKITFDGSSYHLVIAPFTLTWEDGVTASYLGKTLSAASSATVPTFVWVHDVNRTGDASGGAGITYGSDAPAFVDNTQANAAGYFLIGVILPYSAATPSSGVGGDSPVRTVSNLNTPTFTYTSAQQVIDFGRNEINGSGAPGFIRARVFQNSAVVGRGFPATNPTVGSGNVVSGGSDATSILGVPITGTPVDGDILQYNATANEWQIVGPALKAQAIVKTTASLGNGSSETGAIAVGCKSFILISSAGDKSCRIQLYGTAADRDADAGRAPNTPPDPLTQNGIMADHLLTAGGAETFNCAPPLVCTNHDAPRANTIYYRITNNSGSTGTVTATLTIVPVEL